MSDAPTLEMEAPTLEMEVPTLEMERPTPGAGALPGVAALNATGSEKLRRRMVP